MALGAATEGEEAAGQLPSSADALDRCLLLCADFMGDLFLEHCPITAAHDNAETGSEARATAGALPWPPVKQGLGNVYTCSVFWCDLWLMSMTSPPRLIVGMQFVNWPFMQAGGFTSYRKV